VTVVETVPRDGREVGVAHGRTMNRRFLGLAIGSALLIGATLPLPTMAKAPDSVFTKGGIFIVQLVDAPVVAYQGGKAGLAATAPAKGQKINPNSLKVSKYAEFLTKRQNAELRAAGGGRKLYSYVYSFNGFAAKLSAREANRLAADKHVLTVSPAEKRVADTSNTPDFLGLTAEGGIWEQLGGPANAGEGVIIGIIDSGIWPESLSFADRVKGGMPSNAPGAKLAYRQIPGWHGKCVPGEQFTASLCNQKLIGAQYFNAAQGGNAGINANNPWEFNSVRDYNGHGTHTASTAGGNFNTPTTGAASLFGEISGMAPRARIAAYKALWSSESADTASGSTPDLVAAIDQAVADGVDVINYSVSGSTTNFADPVEISFLFAADAGIFVATSAGNSGPAVSTVAHPSPWVTTVAAGTHNRDGRGSVTLGNGTTYNGASVASQAVSGPVVNAEDVALAGADLAAAALCFTAADNGGEAVLDPAKVAGKIVVCDRGVNARTNKSLAVQDAGGIGVILVNTSTNSINADFHFVPTVHLQADVRAAVKAYADTAGATATINQATIVYDAPAPFTAAFSSRGPLNAGGGDLLKPDVIAPGQDILAAVAPPGQHGQDFSLLSGTSMSSPHVAGLAALFMDLYPGWSPMAIKSALMTTGTDILDGPNTNPLVIFRQGAGHVNANGAMDPGLVFDSGFLDWLAFLCGTTAAVGQATCDQLEGLGFSLDASDFNGASVAIGDLAGIQTVTRTVTNVSDDTSTYEFSHTGLAGIDVEVSPASFTIDPGESATVEITFTRTSATLTQYVGGQLTWSDGDHDVRVPAVIRPVALAAPAEVQADPAGDSYDVGFGFDGAFSVSSRGLIPATTTDGSVADDPTDSFDTTDPTDNQGIATHDVVVGAGTTYARFSTFDASATAGSDLDLYVYRVGAGGALTLVGISGSGTSEEEVSFSNPTAATYRVFVHGFNAPGGSADYTLFTWVLGTADAGNMTATAPATAVTGETGTVELSFTGLTAGTKYLGQVVYVGGASTAPPTVIRVDP
jgi:subtilisin family serine protease